MGNEESVPTWELRRELEREPAFIALRKRAQRMQIFIEIQDKNAITTNPGQTAKGTLLVPLPSSFDAIHETIRMTEAALSARAIDQGYLEFGYQSIAE